MFFEEEMLDEGAANWMCRLVVSADIMFLIGAITDIIVSYQQDYFLEACFIQCANLTTCPLYFLFLCGISFHMFGCSIIRPIGPCPSESFLYRHPRFGLPAHLFTWEVSVSQDYIS